MNPVSQALNEVSTVLRRIGSLNDKATEEQLKRACDEMRSRADAIEAALPVAVKSPASEVPALTPADSKGK